MSTVDVVEQLKLLRLAGVYTRALDALVVCPGGSCVTIYNPSLELEWDSEGRLVEVRARGVDEGGHTRVFRRRLTWSPEGLLTGVSAWEEVT